MRAFTLQRDEDATGVSGVGTVADGVVFPDGTVALRWRSGAAGVASTVLYDEIEAVEKIHGHGGMTRIAWSAERSHGAQEHS